MNLRLTLPTILWLGAMILVFVTPLQNPPHLFFGFLPSRALVHTILFLGFTHSSMSSLKKQLKYEKLRTNAAYIVLGAALTIAVLSELFMYLGGIKSSVCLWTILFDVVGTLIGIGTFKLLYHSCC